MAAGAVEETDALAVDRVRVTLLGPLSIKRDERWASPWYRPAARRLRELVMLTPARRLGPEAARELLFPKLAPAASASALSTALSLARETLAPLGQVATALLRADRAIIWVDEKVTLDIDAAAHEQALRSALRTEPGAERDFGLSTALQQDRAFRAALKPLLRKQAQLAAKVFQCLCGLLYFVLGLLHLLEPDGRHFTLHQGLGNSERLIVLLGHKVPVLSRSKPVFFFRGQFGHGRSLPLEQPCQTVWK